MGDSGRPQDRSDEMMGIDDNENEDEAVAFVSDGSSGSDAPHDDLSVSMMQHGGLRASPFSQPEPATGGVVDDAPLSVEDAMDLCGGQGWYQAFMVSVVGIGLFGVFGGAFVLINPVFTDVKIAEDFEVDTEVIALGSSALFAGWALGAPILGNCADTYGRKPVLHLSTFFVAIMLFMIATAKSMPIFLVLKLLLGFGVGGTCTAAYVLVIESIGASIRGGVTILINGSFSIGMCLLSVAAYQLREWSWRQELAVYASPLLLIGVLVGLVSESPQHLVGQGHVDEAEEVLRTIARWNGRTLPAGFKLASADGKSDDKDKKEQSKNQGATRNLFRPSLRPTVLRLFFIWFSCTYVYYGLSFSAGNLSGSIYFNNMLLGLVELPGLFICAALVSHDGFGRRYTQLGSFAIAGLALLPTPFISNTTVSLLFALIGKCGIASAFNVVYVYTGELLPTSVRVSGVGICSVLARIGGILAPLVVSLPIWVSTPLFSMFALISAALTMGFRETLGARLEDLTEEERMEEVPLCKSVAEAERVERGQEVTKRAKGECGVSIELTASLKPGRFFGKDDIAATVREEMAPYISRGSSPISE